jgi:hypothetical protein
MAIGRWGGFGAVSVENRLTAEQLPNLASGDTVAVESGADLGGAGRSPAPSSAWPELTSS